MRVRTERLGNYARGASIGGVFIDSVDQNARFSIKSSDSIDLRNAAKSRTSVVSESDAMDPLSPIVVVTRTRACQPARITDEWSCGRVDFYCSNGAPSHREIEHAKETAT